MAALRHGCYFQHHYSYRAKVKRRSGSLQVFPIWARICNAAISYWRYVRIMLWPDPLMAYYYHESNSVSIAAAVLSVIALILVTAGSWRYRKIKPYCLVGWLWFLGALCR